MKSSQDVLIPVTTYPKTIIKHHEISKLMEQGFSIIGTGFTEIGRGHNYLILHLEKEES